MGFSQCITPIIVTPTSSYSENFEANNGNWFVSSASVLSDWAWGHPNKATINSSASGSNCWITGGLTASFYNYGEHSYLQSPCFDLRSLTTPYISFNVFWESENGNDGANLQYSTDNGTTWKIVGTQSDPPCLNKNWYNGTVRWLLDPLSGAQNTRGWSGSTRTGIGGGSSGNGSGGWVLAEHIMPYSNYPDLLSASSVIFRFAFGAGTLYNGYDGFAIDDFFIGEAPPPPITPVLTAVQPSCNVFTGTINITAPLGAEYSYSINGGPFTSTTEFINLAPGSYTITVKNDHNCTSQNTININTPPPIPSSPAVISPIYYVLNEPASALSATGQNLLWYTTPSGGTGSSAVPIPSTNILGTKYYYVSQTINGCESPRSAIEVNIVINDEIFVPNAFTPNGDNINDILYAYGGMIKEIEMRIFNQWGQEIFYTTDPSKGWDGTYKGKPQPSGVYMYALRAYLYSGKEVTKKGSVTLIR